MTSLLNVEGVLFVYVNDTVGIRLRDDYQDAWAALVPIASALLANGSIAGFFLGEWSVC